MARDTILYISDQATSGNSVLAALEATGYAVVSTPSSTQAIALLFVMHSSATAVVLDQRAGEETSFDLIRNLRSICPDVPILLLCRDQVDRLPSGVDACVSIGQQPEHVTAAVRRLLTAKRIVGEPVHRGSAASMPTPLPETSKRS
jgi:DNA-binding response OmpR family regulator